MEDGYGLYIYSICVKLSTANAMKHCPGVTTSLNLVGTLRTTRIAMDVRNRFADRLNPPTLAILEMTLPKTLFRRPRA